MRRFTPYQVVLRTLDRGAVDALAVERRLDVDRYPLPLLAISRHLLNGLNHGHVVRTQAVDCAWSATDTWWLTPEGRAACRL